MTWWPIKNGQNYLLAWQNYKARNCQVQAAQGIRHTPPALRGYGSYISCYPKYCNAVWNGNMSYCGLGFSFVLCVPRNRLKWLCLTFQVTVTNPSHLRLMYFITVFSAFKTIHAITSRRLAHKHTTTLTLLPPGTHSTTQRETWGYLSGFQDPSLLGCQAVSTDGHRRFERQHRLHFQGLETILLWTQNHARSNKIWRCFRASLPKTNDFMFKPICREHLQDIPSRRTDREVLWFRISPHLALKVGP
jgi:hypothetical protein